MTRALILAAGKGERLRPLTDDKPKGLVQLKGKSLIKRQIDTLEACGVSNIHIATGYRSDQIEALGLPTTRNPVYETTNMVESFFHARDFFSQNDDLLIGYGDIIYQEKNLQAVLGCTFDICLMIDQQWRRYWNLRMNNPLEDAETLIVNDLGLVTELGKKPKNYDQIQGQYTGLIKINGSLINDLISFYEELDRNATYDGKPFDNMYMTSFLQLLIDTGWQAKAVMVSNGWLEVDTLDDLDLYHDLIGKGKLESLLNVTV